jgi:peptidoglycan/LPS O-acetylase OafA/YrhL
MTEPSTRAPGSADPLLPVGEAAVLPSFPALDTLRAVGALAVLTTHTAFWGGDYTRRGALGTVLARLDVGVALFFVLSGFLLSYPHLARARAGLPAPRTGPYLWKRLLRIAPVYVITVVVALTLIGSDEHVGVRGWVRTLLMLDTFTVPALPAGLTHMWSLAVEVTFYLLLPLLMLAAVGHGRRLRAGRVGAVLASLAVLAVAWQGGLADVVGRSVSGAPREWLPGYLLWFAIGIALALVHVQRSAGEQHRWHRTLVVLGGLPGSCWALAGGLLLLAATPLAGPSMLDAPSAAESLTKNLLYAAVAALVVLPAVLGTPQGRFATVFGARPLRHLGQISYGVFCLHLPLLHLVMAVTGYRLFDGHGLQIWLLTVLGSLLVAEVVYRCVERPAMRLRGVWSRPRDAESSAAAVSETSTR